MGLISHTVVEITVISGEKFLVTEDLYVVVRAESLNCYTTKMAKDSGINNSSLFSWNEKLMLKMPMHASSITFQVQCNRFKALRPVGVARIPVSDFLACANEPENSLHLFSYRLRDWEGKANGVIHFSVRVAPPPEKRLNFSEEPLSKDSGGERFEGINVGDDKSNQVVVGVPP